MLTDEQIKQFHALGRKACEKIARNYRNVSNAGEAASHTFTHPKAWLNHENTPERFPLVVMEWQTRSRMDLSSLLRIAAEDQPAAVAAMQAGALAYAEELDG